MNIKILKAKTDRVKGKNRHFDDNNCRLKKDTFKI